MQFGVGQPVRRKEDVRLLIGAGCYVDDIDLPNVIWAHILRSLHAHARILDIDTNNAARAAGVRAVLTGADVEADGLGHLPALSTPKLGEGESLHEAPQPVLVTDRVRHVGEPIAIVLAETPAAARDGAELLDVGFEQLPVAVATGSVSDATAPRLWPDVPNNICYTWRLGDAVATNDAFARADHVTRLKLINNRLVINAVEPRAAIGEYDAARDRFILHTSSQVPHRLKTAIADVFGLPAEKIRVRIRDVGGGFGAKNGLYPEQVLVLWAARRLGRPVKWIGTNSEGFVSDIQGRDHVTDAELALDAEGRFLGLRVRTTASLGAYVSSNGAFIPTAGVPTLAGVYTTPAIDVQVRAVFANAVRTDAYRGAGRPEACYSIERLVDAAARELGMSPVELRRRNFIPPESLPYATPLGLNYDVAEFEGIMDDASARADGPGFPERRRKAERQGHRRGIGLACFVERVGGLGMVETTALQFDADGSVTILSGGMANGQGHETAFAQLAASRLGLDIEQIHLVQGDTDRVASGTGTAGSRTCVLGGSSLYLAVEQAVEKGKAIAAHLLEAAPADIEFGQGAYVIAGTDRTVTMAEVIQAAHDPAALPSDVAPDLDTRASFEPHEHAYPYFCHIAELEVDPATGFVALCRYTAVSDFGTELNPLIVAGQVQGGVAQGVGQALLEHTVYDPDTGQLLSGSLMDYCLPRAYDLPALAIASRPIPCPSNPLGVKGCGESGAAGPPPAIMNALLDALAPLGVQHIDMPVTSERVWRAIHQAAAA